MNGKNTRLEKMPNDYLAPGHTVVLRATGKRDALKELVEVLCADAPARWDAARVLDAVWRREQTLSTLVMPQVAIPHARVDGIGKTLVAVGKSAEGIAWDPGAAEPVRLVILIIGSGNEHLHVLGRIATRLSNKALCEELLATPDIGIVHGLLTQPYPLAARFPKPVLHDLSIRCFGHAQAIAREIKAGALVLHADAVGDISFLENCQLAGLRLILVSRDLSRYPRSPQVDRFLPVPFGGLNRSSQIDIAFLFLVSQGLLGRGDRVVSVCGVPESGILDTIMVADLGRDYRLFFPAENGESLPSDVEPQVLSRVLQVAGILAAEGREGKPVGTMFVVGDHERVREHCRQMVINPFKGYAEDERNILDPSLEETIKEFSRIDGAFVLRGDGVIVSAGTYIRTGAEIDQLSPGLGARHAASAIITRQTHALSVALSESTRKVSLFRQGERVLEL